MFKKLFLLLNLTFLKIIHRFDYQYYLKHFPFYLKRMGVRFSGNISNTGFIASNVKFDSVAYATMIEIGENTIISDNVLILVHDYSIGTAIRSVRPIIKGSMPHFLKSVKIGNNCFIGARAVILPGTTIGDNTINGAGAVVKGNIPSGMVVAGNPAKIIKETRKYAELHIEEKDFIGEFPGL